ncbi:MAG: 6-bladed beta-propeller [Methanosarcinales archaeon]
MKRIICLIAILFIFCYCSPKREKIEKTIENGIEVIINHTEPYRIKGEYNTFNIEERFTIDTERDDIARLGLADIESFDLDSEDNIYLLSSRKSPENTIFKFDKNGEFISSFGRKGQGPGEILLASYLGVTHRDEIAVIERKSRKLLFFSRDGNFIKEIRIEPSVIGISPLPNGKYLKEKYIRELSSIFQRIYALILCDSEFREIRQLDKLLIPNRPSASFWTVSKNNIFVGNEKRGYIIHVFDLEGNFVRKISKEYKPIDYPEEWKRNLEKAYEALYRASSTREKMDIPTHLPPFYSFFTDEEGRLVVRTWEKGENPDEYIHDIYNSEGIFVGRKSFKDFMRGEQLNTYVKIKNNRLYGIRVKESGHKELGVYEINWGYR